MSGIRLLVVGTTALLVVAYVAAGFGGVSADGGVAPATGDGGVAAAADFDDGGPLEGDVNLSYAETGLHGERPNDTAGWSVARGDADGDGQADLLVGAPGSDRAGEDAGVAYLFLGPVDRGSVDPADADVRFTGVAAGDEAGRSVAIGDVDGDGRAEVVVGAPGSDAGGADAGAVYVLELTGGEGVEVSLADADATLVGEQAGDRAGESLAVPEADEPVSADRGGLLVGAPGYADARGAAYLVRDPGIGTTSLADAQARFFGEGAGDEAGFAVTFAGDVDGDGRLDAAVGAPGWRSSTGAAYVVSDVLSTTGDRWLGDAARYEGDAAGDRAGRAVSLAGDFDDDGLDDVVVGAPYNDGAGEDAGAAYVVLGTVDPPSTRSLSAAGVVLRGESAGDHAGYAVSSAGSGDVSCDGVDDVLVGAPGEDATAPDAGAAYVVYGEALAGDSPPEVSLREADAKLRGAAAGDHAGETVLDGSDLSGDGRKDLVVGAPRQDRSNHAGTTYVVYGDCAEATGTEGRSPDSASAERTTATATSTSAEQSTGTATSTSAEQSTDTETKTDAATTSDASTASETPAESDASGASSTPAGSETDTGSGALSALGADAVGLGLALLLVLGVVVRAAPALAGWGLD